MTTSDTTSAPVHSNGGGAEAADDVLFPVAELVGLPFTRAQRNPGGVCLSWPCASEPPELALCVGAA
ncbi:hypothetical protein [Brevibacterium zhoupengii]|uniref:hypothetical protein n=1 Tax=Brevibacterium zhoupengii TaxID=2898795 RepID=UPI001E43207B|nr:hypothetical protein [Brevibacterium zhoupengii]